jgi:hypothetical protein
MMSNFPRLAQVVLDTTDAAEPLRVYADPAGHRFCVFVGAA